MIEKISKEQNELMDYNRFITLVVRSNQICRKIEELALALISLHQGECKQQSDC
jgi:Ca2+-binding EF-hand superfamily protein